jgi:predicted component of type VI protein secretion system
MPESLDADEKETRLVSDSGVVGELRAALPSPSARDKKTLALYALPDQIVVGRGSAADWQIDDDSLSRRHAQLRWNGRDLTIEDLGSANGTKVNARPVRNQTPVRPGDTIQLGNVIVTFELRGAAASSRPSADEQATRLTTAPPPRAGLDGLDGESDPARPLPPVATVVRPPPARGAPKPNAAVFRPTENFAGPDEPTRAWDPNAALVPMPEASLDLGELLRTHRRQLVLGGAAAWIAILLIVWSAFEQKQEAAPPPPPPSPSSSLSRPKVTPLDAPESKAAAVDPEIVPPADDDERAALLAQAITLYDTGKLAEALGVWKRLAAPTGPDGKRDATALFMVTLIDGKLKEGAP